MTGETGMSLAVARRKRHGTSLSELCPLLTMFLVSVAIDSLQMTRWLITLEIHCNVHQQWCRCLGEDDCQI